MKLQSLLYLFLTLIFVSCNGQSTSSSTTIDAQAFNQKIKATPNAQILDVRTPEEFSSEHLDNAKNINWYEDSFTAEVEKLDKTKPVFVYCKSGGRSQSAVTKLEKMGFATIYQLQGGILKWEAAGLSKPNNKTIGITATDYAKLLKTNQKVLINFYAEWCAPCKKMAPYILKLQKEKAGGTTVIRLDADQNKTLMNELKISELPTLLLYENAAVKWKKSGFVSEDELRKQIQ